MNITDEHKNSTYKFLISYASWDKKSSWPEGDRFLQPSNEPVKKLMDIVHQERPKQWLLVSLAIAVSSILVVGSGYALIYWHNAIWLDVWKAVVLVPIVVAGSVGIGLLVYYLGTRDIPTKFQRLAIEALQVFLDKWEQVDACAVGPLLEAFAFWFPLPLWPNNVKDPMIMHMLAHTLPRLDREGYASLHPKQRSIFHRLLKQIWENMPNWERANSAWWDAPINPERDLVFAVLHCSWIAGRTSEPTLKKIVARKPKTIVGEQLIDAAKTSLAQLGGDPL